MFLISPQVAKRGSHITNTICFERSIQVSRSGSGVTLGPHLWLLSRTFRPTAQFWAPRWTSETRTNFQRVVPGLGGEYLPQCSGPGGTWLYIDVLIYSQMFIFGFFIFSGWHFWEFPASQITDLARIVCVANRLPVRVLDEPITPFFVICRCASFW